MVPQYLSILRRWIWLVVLATLLSSAAAYFVAKQQPPSYRAVAQLIVGPGIESPNPDLNDLRTAGLLMETYADLATTGPVLQEVIDELGLPMTPSQLKRSVEVTTDQTTQILTIQATSGDPVQTADIVNALASTLMRKSPSGSDEMFGQNREQMQEQVRQVEADIKNSETAIDELDAQLQAAPNAVDRLQISDQLSQERAHLTEARRTLATLYQAVQTAYTNQVKIVELSSGAWEVASGLWLTVGLAALAGLVLAVGIALASEYLGDTIKSPEDLSHVARVPLLGAIARHKALRGVGRDRLVVAALPESRSAENYRILGSRLLLSRYKAKNAEQRPRPEGQEVNIMVDSPLRSVVVSSTQVSDDASEIAANLAVVLAQTGNRVILVDAYLHNPSIDRLFGVSDRMGLTNLLTGETETAKLVSLDWAPNLSILPSGPAQPNPFDLLVSSRMAELINVLETQADIVILAASPLLTFADSLILASRVDGVVITARAGRARRDLVREITESLHTLDAHIVGVVLDYNRSTENRLPFSMRRRSDATVVATQNVDLARRATSAM